MKTLVVERACPLAVKLLWRRSLSRVSAKGESLTASLCLSHPEVLHSHLHSRGQPHLLDNISALQDLQGKRKEEVAENHEAKRRRHVLSDQIGLMMMKGENKDGSQQEECEKLKLEVENINAFIHESNDRVEKINAEIKSNLMPLPNLLHDSVPDGVDDGDNVVVKEWGSELRKIGDSYLWHDEIAHALKGLDMEAAVRMSGSRFSVLSGQVARLERALNNYFLDYFTDMRDQDHYEEISPPLLVTRSTLEGTGQLPKFEEDLFRINYVMHDEDSFLIPTGEVPLTTLHKGQMIDPQLLPLKYVCSSQCFRAEVGSRGRDARGLFRQHQFQKIEIVKICSPENSEEEYDQMLKDVENLLSSLELPFRKVLLCSGDTGFSASICHDFEVWMPGQQKYREISSVSHCSDFQSRRMSTRYRVLENNNNYSNKKRAKQKKVTVFPHTMNGSGLAIGRTLAAILENFQRSDGSVDIPPVLYPYMNGCKTLAPKT